MGEAGSPFIAEAAPGALLGAIKGPAEASALPESWNILLGAVSDGVSIHSSDGLVLRGNKRLADIYGLELADLTGRGCSELFHQDGQACPHEEVVRTVREVGMLLTRDGKIFRVSLSPIPGEDLSVRGYIRLMHEVTSEEAARKGRMGSAYVSTLHRMISAMAHDIGTPLGIISGYSEYLLMKAKPGEAGHKELNTILQQTRRIAEAIRQMVDLVRAPENRIDAVAIGALLTDVMNLVRQEVKKSGVAVDLHCKDTTPLIYGNSPSLKQAFFNLVIHACENIGQGGRLGLYVEAPVAKPGGFASVTLEGIGAGGAPFDLAEAFSGFVAADSDEDALTANLSLTREILEAAGARMSLTGGGQGPARLAIELPVNLPAAEGACKSPVW